MKEIPPMVNFIAAEPMGGFVLRLWFDDGSQKDVDVERLLQGPSPTWTQTLYTRGH